MDAEAMDPAWAQRAASSLAEAGLPWSAASAAAERCLTSADPAGALSALERFLASHRAQLGTSASLDPPLLDRLIPLLAGSRVFARELAARPGGLALIAASPWFLGSKPRRILERRLLGLLEEVEARDEAGLLRALRRFRTEELLRIAARDLAGAASIAEAMEELSLLAEVCIEAALTQVAEELERRFGVPPDQRGRDLAVLAMGKLGAGELNFSSDVDLILIHPDPRRHDEGSLGRKPSTSTQGSPTDANLQTSGGIEGTIPLSAFWTKLAEDLVRALSQVTADGFVYRVDLDLRPEGRAGPIVIGAEAAYRYYETRGRAWERAALLKARPIAGDRELGERFLSSLEPFVFRRYLDLEAVEEIRAIKAQIDREAAAADRDALDLKLGHGGIREAEFVVVALLLLHAGRNPRLRERRFLPALERLVFAGLLSAQDRDALADAYVFMRRAEHRLQMVDDRRTHRIPTSPRDEELLARRMGFRGSAAQVLEGFRAELDRHRQAIRACFADLLGVGGVEARGGGSELAVALSAGAADERRLEALGACGFFDTASALGELKRLSRKANTPFTQRPPPALAGQAERLIAEVIRSPNPDAALRNLGDFTAALLQPGPYFELLAQHPPTARLLLQLFGTTDALSRYFVRHPELLDSLLRRDGAAPQKGLPSLRAELASRLVGREDREERLAVLRRFKQEELLRIGLNDVSGALDLEAVMEELTAVAESCLEEALALAFAEELERHGALPTARLAVLGLGKLGSRELGYQSDLDLIFVYTGRDEWSAGGVKGQVSASEWFTRLVQRLISHLQLPLREGSLYRVDTRLRPSGSQGTLVVSLEALEVYHQGASALWERQALLRARHVAGDPVVSELAFGRVFDPLLFAAKPEAAPLAAAILEMRSRLDEAGQGGGPDDPKLAPGGLLDVEFAVQYLQLLHGQAEPRLRYRPILPSIELLIEAGLLDEGEGEILRQGWRFFRRLELALQIIHDRPIDAIPEASFARQALGRRLGFTGDDAGAELMEAFRRIAASVREASQRILDGASPPSRGC